MAKQLETRLIHEGTHFNETRSIAPPIYQSATYRADEDIAQNIVDATSTKAPYFYHRHGNPTHNQVAAVIASLEGAEDGLLLSTGMAAISTAVLAVVRAGDHVIVQREHYASALTFFNEFLPEYGVEVSTIDQTDNAAFAGAVRENTRLIYLETPSNPNLSLTDLEFVASLAKSKNIFTMVDNTFASPINQTPLAFGIDAVVHSATKYLGGHSDLTAGAVCGSAAFIRDVWKRSLLLGASLSPFDAWLLLRGLKTLSLRVRQANENALQLATVLARHPKLRSVNYVGLASHPQHDLARRQMKGFTGMLCIDVDGATAAEQFENAQKVLKHCEVFANAVSLGGVESLITHPASLWAAIRQNDLPNQNTPSYSTGLLRLSVGIEHIIDLQDDLERALSQIG